MNITNQKLYVENGQFSGGELMEAQPSITSSYPGEVAKKKKKDDK